MQGAVSSYNTAINRRAESLPLRTILRREYGGVKGLTGLSVLDYGCGKGGDAEYLVDNLIDADSYDPHWKPDGIGKDKYDVVFSTYVLNVLSEENGLGVLKKIRGLLSEGGVAYISVRRDIAVDGATTRGFQRNVELDLNVIFEYSNKFCTYVLRG
jgi:2-polyprenyl-3-methyl-5-hydroxy-6-metoxy-1,4-benzoquinol methylase